MARAYALCHPLRPCQETIRGRLVNDDRFGLILGLVRWFGLVMLVVLVVGHGTSVATLRRCSASDLRVSASFEGAAGHVYGSFVVRKRGAGRCRLEGLPGVRLFDRAGGRIAVRQQREVILGLRGRTIVLRRGGRVGFFAVNWTNVCRTVVGPISWRVVPPGRRRSVAVHGTASGSPPCNAQGRGSTLGVTRIDRRP
jgi:hypothetical protein